MADRHARRPEVSEGDLGATDRRLAVLAREGEADAFVQLIRRHQGPVFRLCWSMLSDRTDAEDAAQETFVRAWESLRRYDEQRDFGPWLRGIAANVCLQALRRRSVSAGRQTSLDENPIDPPAPQEPGLSALAARTVAALRRLDDTYRVPLALFYLEDASVAQVAQALRLSPGAVRVRLHRGREKLREMLMAETEADDAQP
ncbi:MAG: RNA polymerase sigma factor [Armatimonadota bacterium]